MTPALRAAIDAWWLPAWQPAWQRAARALKLQVDADGVERVRQEQLRMLLLHARGSTVAASLFALLAVALLQDQLPPAQLLGWLGLRLLLAGLRLWLALHWLAHAGAALPRLRITWALLALDGALWGLAGWRMADAPLALMAVSVAALDAISCVGTFGLQVSLRATAAYVLPLLLPLCAGLALRSGELAWLAVGGELLLLALQLATARSYAQRLSGGVLLRLQAEQLALQKDQALRLAQQHSALRAQFLAKVSHELRTPLHGILGLARLLHLESTDAQQLRRLELLEGSGTQLLALINDLLDLSRLDSGHFDLRDDAFDLRALLRQLADVFSLRAADKGLRFTLDLDDDLPRWVCGDAARLRQVLNNLLGNAVKFTAQGGVTLGAQLQAPTLAPAGPQPLSQPSPSSSSSGPLPATATDAAQVPAAQRYALRLTVCDTGPGIAAEQRERVFHAFHQAPGHVGQPTEGVGLGLTIARELTQALGGELRLQSPCPPGPGGSCFELLLWLPPALSTVGVGLPASRGRSLPSRVLVAEDDEVNALILAALLDQLGVPNERVADGKQAATRALREVDRPSLVLMDCRMPVMDGRDATREIRVQERALGLPRLPVLALTAGHTEEEIQACLDAGMDAVLAKPYTPEQLVAAMRRLCAASA